MTSNGPSWPEQNPQQPGQYPPSEPPPGQYPPAQPGQYQPGQYPPSEPPPGQYPPAQPPPGQYPPVQPQPGQYPDQATQAVPNYAPPSQGYADQQAYDPYAPNQFQGGTPPGGGQKSGGGQRALLAGVLGGLLALGILTGVGVWLTAGSGDEEPPPDTVALADDVEESATESTPPSTVAERIGTTVDGLGLLSGDCINYDQTATSVTSFDVVACGTPHVAEIAGQAEHPDAGAGFPGVDELHTWGLEQCQGSSAEFLGTDVLETSLVVNTLVPDFNEWGLGLTSVSCLIQAADGSRLIESVAGRGSSYPRSAAVVVAGLRPGDCFLPGPGLTAYELGIDDSVELTPCNVAHDGLFFGRGLVDGDAGDAFPGQDLVDDEGIAICNSEFTRYFGVTHEGFNYRFWSPDQALWDGGDRTIHCAVMDEAGLPTTLDFAAFRPMFSLPIGQCFVFGPEESTDVMRLDDQVEPVDCGQQHHGQLFGFGNLPATSDPFPGSDPLDEQIAQECIALFTDYVGVSPFDSVSGDFIYWFPNETGWASGDLRWACALLTDELRTGSIEGTNA